MLRNTIAMMAIFLMYGCYSLEDDSSHLTEDAFFCLPGPGVEPPTIKTLPRAGDLIKLLDDGDPTTRNDTAVYYLASDGRRYVFPTEAVFYTWYADFSSVIEISASDMAAIPIGGNVTYRPGSRMVKIMADPKVYAVSQGGVLHWVQTEALAADLYGPGWNAMIDDVPDSFFVNYSIGSSIDDVSDYNPSAALSGTTTIDQNLGF